MRWFEVKVNQLPLVNQEILYVVDYRGSPEELWRRAYNKVVENNKDKYILPLEQAVDHTNGVRVITRGFQLFKPYDETMVYVAHGWVHDRYPDAFTVRPTQKYSATHGTSSVDVQYITHWMPMPLLPVPHLTEDEAVLLYNKRMQALKEGNQLSNSWSYEEFKKYQEENSTEES